MYRARIGDEAVIGEHEYKIQIVTRKEESEINFRKEITNFLEKNKKNLKLADILDIQKIM